MRGHGNAPHTTPGMHTAPGMLGSVSAFVGSSPPDGARAVSLRVRDYLRKHFGDTAASAETTPAREADPGGAWAAKGQANKGQANKGQANKGQANKGVVFALSGGADSLALTVAGADVAQRLAVPYAAVIVDHGMRPESAGEAEKVRALVESLGVSAAHILTAPQGARSADGGPETTARALRYALLKDFAARWAKQQNLREVHVLLGHTMEDQAETVLTRLGQGASPRALGAMRQWSLMAAEPARIVRGRPLLSLRRADTERFCATYGLPWVEDPTNHPHGPWKTKEGQALPRAAVRHRVLPGLTEALGQDAVPALARVALISQEDQDALDQYAAVAFSQAVQPRGGGSPEPYGGVSVDVGALAAHPKAVRARVLQDTWLKVAELTFGNGWDAEADSGARRALSQKHVEQLDHLVTTPVHAKGAPVGKVLHLPSFTRAKRTRDALLIWVSDAR